MNNDERKVVCGFVIKSVMFVFFKVVSRVIENKGALFHILRIVIEPYGLIIDIDTTINIVENIVNSTTSLQSTT